MPPFSKTASVILSGFSEAKILEIARDMVRIAPKANVKILGPASSLMSKLAGKYRYRILIIADKKFNFAEIFKILAKPYKNSFFLPSKNRYRS